MSFDPKAFAKAIRAKRDGTGMSLRNLAAYLGLTPATLSRIENAQGSPGIDTYLILVKWLERSAPTPPVQCPKCHGAGVIRGEP